MLYLGRAWFFWNFEYDILSLEKRSADDRMTDIWKCPLARRNFSATSIIFRNFLAIQSTVGTSVYLRANAS
jgi:hypothetical protein